MLVSSKLIQVGISLKCKDMGGHEVSQPLNWRDTEVRHHQETRLWSGHLSFSIDLLLKLKCRTISSKLQPILTFLHEELRRVRDVLRTRWIPHRLFNLLYPRVSCPELPKLATEATWAIGSQPERTYYKVNTNIHAPPHKIIRQQEPGGLFVFGAFPTQSPSQTSDNCFGQGLANWNTPVPMWKATSTTVPLENVHNIISSL